VIGRFTKKNPLKTKKKMGQRRWKKKRNGTLTPSKRVLKKKDRTRPHMDYAFKVKIPRDLEDRLDQREWNKKRRVRVLEHLDFLDQKGGKGGDPEKTLGTDNKDTRPVEEGVAAMIT